MSLALIGVPHLKWSPSNGRTVLCFYVDPLSDTSALMSPNAITVQQLVDGVIPQAKAMIAALDAKLAAAEDRLRVAGREKAMMQERIDGLQAELGDALVAGTTPAADVDPEDEAVYARARALIASLTADGPAAPQPVDVEQPVSPPPLPEEAATAFDLPPDELPVTAAPAVATADTDEMLRLRDLVRDKARSWLGSASDMTRDELTAADRFAADILSRAAALAQLKLDGDPMADLAIAELEQRIPSYAMRAQLRGLNVAREKLHADVREIVGALMVAGQVVIKAALVAAVA